MNRKFNSAYLAGLAEIAARTDAQMAVPADVQVKNQSFPQGELEALRLSNNQLVSAFRLLTAKLDLDAGVTDTNYNALLTDTAAGATVAPQKVTTL